MKKAVIIGASSGIGRELAVILSENNYIVGLAARREELLQELNRALPNRSYIKCLDVSQPDSIDSKLSELISEMNGADLIIICAGTGHLNPELNWEKEKETIDVNVAGFVKLMTCAAQYFISQGHGHIVGISSIGALRGSHMAPAYNASKAFESNYMEGLRCKFKKENPAITVTDIQPGLVDTKMAKGEGLFWVMPAKKAARQIYAAIKRKKKHAYITRRWSIIALILKYLPDWLYYKL